jgi:hypothetical protein
MLRTISLIFILGCAVNAYGIAQVHGVFEKTIKITAGQTFYVENSYGNIVVNTHPGREVLVRGSIFCSADKEADAQAICNEIKIQSYSANGKVGVRTEFPEPLNPRNVGFRVGYTITLPEKTPLDLSNKYGAVTLIDLRADTVIRNSGKVDVQGLKGDLKITNSNGEIFARNITGSLDITQRFENIKVTNVGGNLKIDGGSSTIEAKNIAGEAWITNSFGRVILTGAGGPVYVENNSSVTVESKPGPCQPITIRTMSAPIRLTLGQGGGYKLDANASFGKVSSNLEIEARHHKVSTRNGQVHESLLTGRIAGAGSCDLSLVSSHADIELLRGAR